MICCEEGFDLAMAITPHLSTHEICLQCASTFLRGKIVDDMAKAIRCPTNCGVNLGYKEVKANVPDDIFRR
jgi:hypothetical protein